MDRLPRHLPVGRLPVGVTLCGVVKRQGHEKVQKAIVQGLRVLGVNYVQEGLRLKAALEGQIPTQWDSLEWHYIGKVQSNKIRLLLEHFDLIQSLSSEKHMKILNQYAQKMNKIQHVLIEVNSAKEPAKSGLEPQEVLPFIREARVYSHLRIKGLMTMGPAVIQPEAIRPYFEATRTLFWDAQKVNSSNYEARILSMGMSATYREAIQCGSTLVRLGTLLFGERTV